jgi:uncharacterized protein YabN with tetrapyrrole methylase and pyrophosphatase domain
MTQAAGSLTVVGTGIRTPAQATFEARSHIACADIVFTLVADPVTEYWIRSLNAATESLAPLYRIGKPRWQTYDEIVARIVATVRAGSRVCAVAYGHPGVFAYPLHQAIREATASGHPAKMLAGISAEDCLFAELGVDPSSSGCSSFEATDFLLHRRPVDTSASLILWQIGVIGEPSVQPHDEVWNHAGLAALRDKLVLHYPPHHIVTLFEAARYSAGKSKIVRSPLSDLTQAPVTVLSTLYVPAFRKAEYDAEMARRLGIDARAAAWNRHASPDV